MGDLMLSAECNLFTKLTNKSSVNFNKIVAIDLFISKRKIAENQYAIQEM